MKNLTAIILSFVFSLSISTILYAASPGDVVINEIMWDELEYIELKNTTGSAITIGGWTLKASGTVEVNIDAGATIPAQGFYLITDNGAVDFTPDEIDAMTLNQGGETVTLEDDSGTMIDTANYDGPWFAGLNTAVGEAMERKTPPGNGQVASSWYTSTGNVGGRIGTPGQANSPPPYEPQIGDIVINEIMWDELEYIELRNTTGTSFLIENWQITASDIVEINIDAGATIPANGFYLIADNGAVTGITPNEIDAMNFNQGGEVVKLLNDQGTVFDTANQAGAWYAGQNTAVGEAMERITPPGDGTVSANWYTSTGNVGGRIGTPGQANSSPPYEPQIGDVVINEIMWDELEYIELRNTTETSFSIASWQITASGNVEATIDAGATIPAGGFYLIADSGAVTGVTPDEIDAMNFNQSGEIVKLLDDGGVVFDTANQAGAWFAGVDDAEGISMERRTPAGDGTNSNNWYTSLGFTGGRYGTAGETNSVDNTAPIITHTPVTNATESNPIVITATITDNLEVGTAILYYKKTPDTVYVNVVMVNTTGDIFQETIPASFVTTDGVDYYLKAIDTFDNESSDPATDPETNPHEVTVVPPIEGVVINEIMYDPTGAEPDNEWVELYNNSDTIADVSGWILTDNEGTYTFPASTTIPARGYFTLGHSSSAAGGNLDLVYGAYMTGTISFANTGDNVIIKDASAVIIDQVDYTDTWIGPSTANNSTTNKTLSRKNAADSSVDFTNWGRSASSGGTPQSVNDVNMVGATITHTAITQTLNGRDIGIHANINDDIDKAIEPGRAKVFYRTTGETVYKSVVMSRVSDVDYDAIIPGADVTLSGIEYYIYAIDLSNNESTHGSDTTPHPVTVVNPDPNINIVINEIMYDPAETEPGTEWVELYNADTANSVDLTGWIFGDGEDELTIESGTIIPADGYLVLGRTATAANGLVDIVYGDTAPSIQFQNTLAEITDQVILKDSTGLIIDEVNYSSEDWGQNGAGPNNQTIERLDNDPTRSNDRSNWIASEVNGGTPQARNAPHYIRNFQISPDMFNPVEGETTTISFYLTVAGTVTVKVYDTQSVLVQTLIDSHLFPDTHQISWDGKDEDTPLLDVYTVEVEAIDDTEGRFSIEKIQEGIFPFQGFSDRTDRGMIFNFDYEFAVQEFDMILPGYVNAWMKYVDTEEVVQTLATGMPLGSGHHGLLWNGRDEQGLWPDRQLVTVGILLQVDGIPGNAVVLRDPVRLGPLSPNPRDYFNPTRGDTQYIQYQIAGSGTTEAKIYDENRTLVKTLLDNVEQDSGTYTLQWNGKDETDSIVSDGLYTLVVIVTSQKIKRNQAVDVTVFNF